MLEVRGLNAFHGHAQALWEVDLDVGPAETVAVIGPNGAGKSTLVMAIAGLLRGAAGAVNVGGTNLAAVAAHRVCSFGVAIVPEGRRVFAHMSVRENLLIGSYRRAARAEQRESLARVEQLFPRLAERSQQRARNLSGGEQQMLAIGRALMARPQLLLLDEPSLGLAPVVVDEVFAAIETIRSDGVSVLLVEQDVERALAISNRGYLLAEGRVVTSDTSPRLRANPQVQASVLGR